MKMTTRIMAVLLTVISTVSFAKTNDSTRRDALVRVVTGTANGSYKLIYQGEQGQVQFKLVDQSGAVLHDERLKIENGFIQPINLSQLPSGDYTFIVENKEETLSEAITYTSLEDKLAQNIEIEQVGPQIELKGANLESGDLKVYIYDDKDQLVHQNNISTDKIDQIFELSNIHSNWVNVVVMTPDEVVTNRKFRLK